MAAMHRTCAVGQSPARKSASGSRRLIRACRRAVQRCKPANDRKRTGCIHTVRNQRRSAMADKASTPLLRLSLGALRACHELTRSSWHNEDPRIGDVSRAIASLADAWGIQSTKVSGARRRSSGADLSVLEARCQVLCNRLMPRRARLHRHSASLCERPNTRVGQLNHIQQRRSSG